jgi:hypothetical protein
MFNDQNIHSGHNRSQRIILFAFDDAIRNKQWLNHVCDFEFWSLIFVCNLFFEIWDLYLRLSATRY